MEQRGIKNPLVRYGVAIPVLWLMLIPVVLADICVEIYHHIAFPVFGIPMVERRRYIRIVDRTKLPYLNWKERIGCAYCGYINGWLHYVSVIGGKTEEYFCAIAHLANRGYVALEHEKEFMKYGDASALERRYARVKDSKKRS